MSLTGSLFYVVLKKRSDHAYSYQITGIVELHSMTDHLFNRDLVRLLGGAIVGLHSMTDEHFGISVVEYMAAGAIPIGKYLLSFIFLTLFFGVQILRVICKFKAMSGRPLKVRLGCRIWNF